MRHEILLCDLCHAPISNSEIELSGVGINIYQSVGCGGWGNRDDKIKWSGEVCPTCFAEFRIITQAVETWLRKRDGVKMPIITITEREVSTVRADEPSPGGRAPQLLR